MNRGPLPSEVPSRRPPPSAVSVDAILAAVSRAFEIPVGELEARPQRIRGRATIFLVWARSQARGGSQWVVKVANPAHVVVGIDSPVGPEQEFRALSRLHAHFERVGGQTRVPEPLALLPEIRGFAMEHVPGQTVRALLRYRSLRQPGPLLKGVAGAAQFIRQLHDLEGSASSPINLQTEADQVLSVVTESLRLHGLSLPRQVTRTLRALPPVTRQARTVWLHGDFVPANIILADTGSTVGIDPSLNRQGVPEEDLARFIAATSAHIQFAPGVLAPPINWIRRRLESQLLTSYYGSSRYPALFELKLIETLAGRWLRLRQLSELNDPPGLMRIKFRTVGAQIRMLMRESSHRLVQTGHQKETPSRNPGGGRNADRG